MERINHAWFHFYSWSLSALVRTNLRTAYIYGSRKLTFISEGISLTRFDSLIKGSSHFLLLSQLTQKILFTSKMVKSDPKIIITLLLPRLSLGKSLIHFVRPMKWSEKEKWLAKSYYLGHRFVWKSFASNNFFWSRDVSQQSCLREKEEKRTYCRYRRRSEKVTLNVGVRWNLS